MTTRTRVALTNPYALPDVSRGSETLIHSLGRWLERHDHETTVIATGPRSRTYRLEGVRYETVRAPDLSRIRPDLAPPVVAIPAMARRLRRWRAQLVHSFMYTDAAAAHLARIPCIVSYGGIALRSSLRGQPLLRALLDLSSRRAARLVCPSRAAVRHLYDEFGFRAQHIPNGIETRRFRCDVSTEPGRILCAAAPTDRRKRVEVLVDAFGLLAAGGAEVTLALAGNADARTRDLLMDRLPPAAQVRVEWMGNLAEERLVQEYARASVSCLPSLHEAFGLVVVESMAAGTPVVVADHGALPELVDDDVGARFVPDDARDCARALRETLARAAEPDLADRCRRRARCYDWDHVGPRWIELYQEVLA